MFLVRRGSITVSLLNRPMNLKSTFSTYHIYKTGGISEEDPYKQFAKYILRKLENRRQEDKKSELKVFEYGGESSLEHIFPVKYSKEEELSGWEAFWDEGLEKYKTDYIFRVGNYTILHYKLNSKVSDGPWDEKKKTPQRFKDYPYG